MSRVELLGRIRRDREVEEASIRELATRYRVHRRTVHQALESAIPPPRKTPERDRPVLGGYEEVIRDWLRADETAPATRLGAWSVSCGRSVRSVGRPE